MMNNLTEKRRFIHDWIEIAGEEEVDQFLEKILGKEPESYNQKLAEELNWRLQKHLDGTSESFTRADVNAKLNAQKIYIRSQKKN